MQVLFLKNMFELFKNGIIDKKNLLILNYSKLKINEHQLAIIFLIMELSTEDKKSFTSSELAKYMTISKDQIENEISNLLKNKFIKLEQKSKKINFDLTPLFNKLIVIIEEENFITKEDNLHAFVEKLINCSLTVDEIEKINNYANLGISRPKIVSIINEKKITNINDLFVNLELYLKSIKTKITFYNWLND